MTTSATPSFTLPDAPPATGQVISATDKLVIFKPDNTTYQLHLLCAGFAGPLNKPISARVRVHARKIWTVPSGGNFIAPILGTPRIIQGRVIALDQKGMVVQAGVPVSVDFPADDTAFDLANGSIALGTMVNVTAMPGASIELVKSAGM